MKKNKLLLLPDLAKRPKHHRHKIVINSFATAVAAKAIENGYHGPHLVKDKDDSEEDDYDPIADLLDGLSEMDYQPDSYTPLHLVKKKDDCHQQSSSGKKLIFEGQCLKALAKTFS